MGKKRITIIGSEQESELKSKRTTQLEQKKMRSGIPGKKTGKAPGMAGGQRLVDTTEESLAEFDIIEAKRKEAESLITPSAEIPVKTSTKHRVGRSQKYKQTKAKINTDQTYHLPEALKLLREITSDSKFDQTVELHLVTKDKNLNKTIQLPHPNGKTRKIAIVSDQLLAGLDSPHPQLDFDLLLTSPDFMPKLVKYAKILGPRGLMPNPKTHTIVDDPEAEVKKLTSGNNLTLKTDKDAPVIHTVVGKLSQPDTQLTDNINAILPTFPLTKAVLKSTMTPAIKLQI